MRNKIIFVLLLSLVVPVVSQDIQKDKVLIRMVLSILESRHVTPRQVDDELSRRAFGLYLKRLDYGKRFLLAPDVEKLKKYELAIDDQAKTGNLILFHTALALLEKRIRETRVIAEEIVKSPLDFATSEFWESDPEKRDFCRTRAQLKGRWLKTIKYRVLTRYLNEIGKRQDTTYALPVERVNIPPQNDSLFNESQAAETRSLNRMFDRLLDISYENRLGGFINAITRSFDPHTNYMPPQRKEDFDIDMTGTLEGIGAVLQEDDGNIKVVQIIPGSASWRQKELKPDDLILKVSQADGPPEDIVDMPLYKAVRLIRGPKGTEVRLTVKKPDGRIMIIPIIRDVVIIEEAYARSAVINSSGRKKNIGYIYLPKFYHDIKHTGSRNSSDDIRKELDKMGRENIRGLILDLRNNTGGSLDDAVKVAGLFVPQGPIVQVRDRQEKIAVLEDRDKTVSYSGPLVVLVDTRSASASEIVAAALQDYRRAVIVGSKHSFGKGTVQQLRNLDRMLNSHYHHLRPLGALKFTIQKFYRINGGATQYKGVIPDIILPDPLGYIEVGEKEMDYSLPWDTVSAQPYQVWNNPPELVKLRKTSRTRTGKNRAFSLISSHVEELDERRENTLESLETNTAWKNQYVIRRLVRRFNEERKKLVTLSVNSLQADLPKLENDPDRADIVKDWQNQRIHDPYIEEALHILSDMK